MNDDVFMRTYSRRVIYPSSFSEDDIIINDIAHSLAYMCRYVGHVSRFYSVAEHSVIVSHLVQPELALYGLLHDASEAYISDIAKGWKPLIKGYKKLEISVMKKVAKRFNLPWPPPIDIKRADTDLIECEMNTLIYNIPDGTDMLECWPPEYAYHKFMVRYGEIVLPSPTWG